MKDGRVSVVIPCYNDTKYLQRVINACTGSPYCDEVLVVDDGSAKRHKAALSALTGARVLTLARNRGKSYALRYGTARAQNNAVVFLDADISNFAIAHFNALVEPVFQRGVDMVIGAREKEVGVGIMLGFSHAFTGERAFRMKDRVIPLLKVHGYLCEPSMNRSYFHRGKVRMVLLRGVGQTWRPKKTGVNGLVGLTKLVIDYVKFLGADEFLFQLKFARKLQKHLQLVPAAHDRWRELLRPH